MIECWTDGACIMQNPRRPGGWAYLIRYENIEGEEFDLYGSGKTFGTTSHQMELMAILQAIRKIGELLDRSSDEVTINSDSQLAVNCITGVYECKARVIRDYLNEIEWTTGTLKIDYVLIEGHSGIKENENVNALAQYRMRMLLVVNQ